MSLINKPQLRVLYNRAKSSELHKPYSREFFEWILPRVWFTELNTWYIASEVPPTDDPGERERVNLAIKYFKHDTFRVRVLYFIDAKRASTTPARLLQGEEQTFNYYNRHCDDSGVPFIYIIMTKGATARFLIFYRGEDHFHPMLENDDALGGPTADQFHDPDTISGASYWTNAFRIMKENPNSIPLARIHEHQPYMRESLLPAGITRHQTEQQCLLATVGDKHLKIVPPRYFFWNEFFWLWDGSSVSFIIQSNLPQNIDISFPRERVRRRLIGNQWVDVAQYKSCADNYLVDI